MRRVVWFSLGLMAGCMPCRAQTADDALKQTLMAQVKEFMADWQRGNSGALRALLAPEFVYVGENGPTPAKPVVDTLTQHCHLASFTLGEPTMLRTGPASAVLIYTIHQDLSCFGKPEAVDVVNTDTLVRRDGRWLFLMTTSAPLRPRGGPPA